MSKIMHQRVNTGRSKALATGWEPIGLYFVPAQRTSIRFTNGQDALASCLHCEDTPCANFLDDEVTPSNFERFPADRNLEVCATGAIAKPEEGGAPTIDGERCILCGVCASRCPVGAIRLVPGIGAVINDEPNNAFRVSDITFVEGDLDDVTLKGYSTNKINNFIDAHVAITTSSSSPGRLREEASFYKEKAEQVLARRMFITGSALRKKFIGIQIHGCHLIESDAIVNEVFVKLQHAWTRVGDRFPNILARNLLKGAGLGASVGRKGNNHMRMDIILSPPGVQNGVAEVEFGQDAVLDAPRDTMDALAVLVSRYGWTLDSTTAIIVSDVLPNRRSEYWHIIQDIANVLGVKIGTVTIFALMLYNWNRKILNLSDDKFFYIDRDTESYRSKVLEIFMGRSLHLGTSPRSQIDIAK